MKAKIVEKIFIVTVIISLCLSTLIIPVNAASAPDIVHDGLVAWYDGANNSNGEQNYETTVWRDLSGNGHHIPMRLNETNYWTDNAFHIDASSYYFPDAITDVVNSDTYTIEFVAGNLSYAATNWITLMCSDNDELSVFIRVPNGSDTDTNFEYKYNDKNDDRPMIDKGAETVNNTTIAITFDLSNPAAGECIVYIDGVAMGQGIPAVTNIADSVTFGHENPQRAWSGDIYGFRFYDRALSPEEVMANADADYKKYRSGNYYPPEQQYDSSNEDIDPGLTGEFKNDVIPLISALDLIPYDGFYGTESIIDNIYAYEDEWLGACFIAAQEADTSEDGTEYTPSFHVNYEKYCRKTGLTALKGEDVTFAVLKLRVEGGYIGDITIHPMAGVDHWYLEVPSIRSYYGSALSTGETEYLIYDLTGKWDGQINMFKFVINDMDPDATVYVDEIALFADEEAALAYAEEEIETESETTDAPAIEAPTNAPATEVPTDAPATDSLTETDTPAQSGCGSVIGFGALAVMIAAAAFVALKKKD